MKTADQIEPTPGVASRRGLDPRTADVSLFPRREQATDKNAICPFRVNCSGSGTYRIAPAHQRHKVARAGNGYGCNARRATRDDAGTRALLGDGVRLAQDRGKTERPAAVRHRDRWTGHSFHSRSFETRKCACRSSSRTDGPARSSSR